MKSLGHRARAHTHIMRRRLHGRFNFAESSEKGGISEDSSPVRAVEAAEGYGRIRRRRPPSVVRTAIGEVPSRFPIPLLLYIVLPIRFDVKHSLVAFSAIVAAVAIAIGGALLIAALKRARMAPDDRPVDPYVVESPTPLMRLASVGDAGGVRALLQQSAHGDGDRSTQHEGGARAVGPGGPADVNAVFQQQSALHAALAGRHAQLSEAGRGGREAALRGEHERVVELLLSAPGAHAGPPVFCPVRDAVHYRAVREISTLLRAMPAPDVAACLQEVDYYGDTPLHVAARSKGACAPQEPPPAPGTRFLVCTNHVSCVMLSFWGRAAVHHPCAAR